MTANQIVAHNLRRARLARDWTLEETCTRLEPALGERWTVPTLSSAEGSRHGRRIRRFDADQIDAFAKTFNVDVGFFFQAPEANVRTSLGLWKTSDQEDVAAALRQTARLLERIAEKEEG
jgi:transcriptional regulator with XRE-family HTH domain